MSIVCFLADRLDRETCTKPIRKQKEEDYAACSEPSTHLLIYVDRNPETILPAVRIHHRPLYRRPSLTDDLGVYGKLSIFIRLRRQWGVMTSPHIRINANRCADEWSLHGHLRRQSVGRKTSRDGHTPPSGQSGRFTHCVKNSLSLLLIHPQDTGLNHVPSNLIYQA